MASFSTESLSYNPETSILLGMQAVNAFRLRQPSVPAAEEALHQAILSSPVRETLKGHTGSVESVAWSPDGKRLATASDDRTVQIYAIDVRELLDLARKRVTRDLTRDECERYFQSEKCPPPP